MRSSPSINRWFTCSHIQLGINVSCSPFGHDVLCPNTAFSTSSTIPINSGYFVGTWPYLLWWGLLLSGKLEYNTGSADSIFNPMRYSANKYCFNPFYATHAKLLVRKTISGTFINVAREAIYTPELHQSISESLRRGESGRRYLVIVW